MLRLSKLTDYAIVLLGHFAHGGAASALGGESAWTARTLADRSKLPLPTVSKVLKTLARAGLLASQRGVAGGYTLTKPAEAVSIADVIIAIDGPIALTECVESHELCDLESSCPTKAHWTRINDAVRSALQSLSIRDMTAPHHAPPPEQLVHLGARTGARPGARRHP